MSLANEQPELLEPQSSQRGQETILPLKSMTKAEIENDARNWLTRWRSTFDTPEVYVYLKQMEEAVKKAIEIVKEEAFNDTGMRLRGEKSGEVLGHNVKLTYPERYQYSVAVKRLELQQKLDMDALKAKERADGIATKEPGKGVITVTLTQQ